MRTTQWLAVVAVVLLAAQGVRAQTPPAWLQEKADFLEATRQAACPDPKVPFQCAQGLLAAAEDRLASGLPWSSDLFQEAALAFLKVKAVPEAIAAYARMEATGETDHVRAYAACRVGELHAQSHQWASALAAYERTTDALEVLGIHIDPRLYARACLNVAEVHRRTDNLAQAIASRSRILNQSWTPALDAESHVGMAYVRNARDHFALGHVDTGRAWLDAFFTALPEWGIADGRRILLKLERALAGRNLGTTSDDATVQQLVSLWTDPQWWSYPEIMVCASNLETLRSNRREMQLLREHLVSARGRFNQHEAQWKGIGGERFAEAVECFESITIQYMSILLQSREWALAHQVGEDLLSRYPMIEDREFVLEMIDEAARQME